MNLKVSLNDASGKSEETKIVIIGAGVAGLSLALFLQNSGVDCVVLEKYQRADLENRHRAGFLDAEAIAVFKDWGLLDKLPEKLPTQGFEVRIDGRGVVVPEAPDDDETEGRFCTQQQLVTAFLRELIDVRGVNVRFGVDNINLTNEEQGRPRVQFHDAAGEHELTCSYVAGCDGGHSASRSSIPHEELTEYAHEFGYAWLAALVEAPVSGPSVVAISERGYAAHITRGPELSRVYLQCLLSDSAEDWPDDRIWSELRQRFGDPDIPSAPIRIKDIVPMRSVMFTPMQYRNLFLAGDAAHLVPPTAAKGMSLALHDVDALAKAMIKAVDEADESALRNYTNTVLPYIWKEQENSASATDTFHDAGDPTLHGKFRQMTARVRVEAFLAPLLGEPPTDKPTAGAPPPKADIKAVPPNEPKL